MLSTFPRQISERTMSRSVYLTMSHRFSDSRLLGIRTMSYKRYSTITFPAIPSSFQVSIHKQTALRTFLEVRLKLYQFTLIKSLNELLDTDRRRTKKQMARVVLLPRETQTENVLTISWAHCSGDNFVVSRVNSGLRGGS